MKKAGFIVGLLFTFFIADAQVGIGTVTPDASSVLDISAADKGLLIPQVSLSDVTDDMLDGVNTAATGLLIWNTNASVTGGDGIGFYYFNGTDWEKLRTADIDDVDWYKTGTTSAPTTINDSIFTLGNVTIGDTTTPYKLGLKETNDTINRVLNIQSDNATTSKSSSIHNEINYTGTDSLQASYNYINDSGTGVTIGSMNEIEGSGFGSEIGLFNKLYGSSITNKYGVYNDMKSVSSAAKYGMYNDFLSASGTVYGLFNVISHFGFGSPTGVYNSIVTDDHTTGVRNYIAQYGQFKEASGVNNFIDGSNGSWLFGVQNIFENDGDGQLVGTYNSIHHDADGTGGKYGVYNNFQSLSRGIHYGMYSNFDGNGTDTQYGVYSEFNATGSGTKYGIFSDLTGTGPLYGHSMSFSNGGSSEVKGLIVNASGIGDGDEYGFDIDMSNSGSGNGDRYGGDIDVVGSGTGDKFGLDINISNIGGGTQYGLRSNVLKSGSYAGYFLGNVSVGTTTSNNYLLPASRGTANQVIQTDGSGNLNWVDTSTIGDDLGNHTATTNLNMNSNNIDAVTRITTTTGSTYNKIRLWTNDNQTIGLHSGMTYGFLGDYAMTFTMGNDSNRGWIFRDIADSQADGAMSLTTGGRMTLKSDLRVDTSTLVVDATNNNVGVKLTNPIRNLHLYIDRYTGASNYGGLEIEQSYNGNGWTLYTSQSSSNLSLYFNNNIRGSFNNSSGIYSPLSDVRLKKNIEDINSSIDKIMELRPKLYHFNSQNNTEKKNPGFLAQDVIKIFPDIVDVLEDDTNGNGIPNLHTLSYTEFVPYLVKGIQEQQTIIDDLKQQLKDQQQQINAIKAILGKQ